MFHSILTDLLDLVYQKGIISRWICFVCKLPYIPPFDPQHLVVFLIIPTYSSSFISSNMYCLDLCEWLFVHILGSTSVDNGLYIHYLIMILCMTTLIGDYVVQHSDTKKRVDKKFDYLYWINTH